MHKNPKLPGASTILTKSRKLNFDMPFMFVIYIKFQGNWFHINGFRGKTLSKCNETNYSSSHFFLPSLHPHRPGGHNMISMQLSQKVWPIHNVRWVHAIKFLDCLQVTAPGLTQRPQLKGRFFLFSPCIGKKWRVWIMPI